MTWKCLGILARETVPCQEPNKRSDMYWTVHAHFDKTPQFWTRKSTAQPVTREKIIGLPAVGREVELFQRGIAVSKQACRKFNPTYRHLQDNEMKRCPGVHVFRAMARQIQGPSTAKARCWRGWKAKRQRLVMVMSESRRSWDLPCWAPRCLGSRLG